MTVCHDMLFSNVGKIERPTPHCSGRALVPADLTSRRFLSQSELAVAKVQAPNAPSCSKSSRQGPTERLASGAKESD